MDSQIIKYACRLFNRKMDIGQQCFKERRGMTESEKMELEIIRRRLQRVRDFQKLRG